MKLTDKCTLCGKVLEEIERFPLSDTQHYVTYKCGHALVVDIEQTALDTTALVFTSVNGDKQARHYQQSGIEFILGTGDYAQYAYRGVACIIADQMRLGKTPQSLLALRNIYKTKCNKCLIIVRSANLYQWINEYKTWTDPLPLGIFPIIGTKNWIPPGFHTYIISMDTFSRKGMVDTLLAFGFDLVIADEAHSFKNPESNRSQALIKFLHDISETEITRTLVWHCVYCKHNWETSVTVKVNVQTGASNSSMTTYSTCPECNARMGQSQTKHEVHERKCGIILLTGTPIKNRADEWFIPLNIVAPQRFPSLDRFRRNWLMQDAKGKWSRVHPYKLDAFRAEIAPYVLRREKEDVYTDTPPLNRMYTVITIEDVELRKLYNQQLDIINTKVAAGKSSFTDLQDNLMFLRRICGMAKVKWAADYVELSLESDDILTGNGTESARGKIAIGMHHESVRNALLREIGDWRCMTLDGSHSAERKYEVMTKFESNDKRVLIMNMLAGGVGMDFHYLDNVLVLERQWSSADEEQFEFRFYNPDLSIKNRPTNIEYVIAQGTIDNWWYDMVQAKRQIFGETLGGHWDLQNDPDSFNQLLEQTLASRI